jgi:hypothetical protein
LSLTRLDGEKDEMFALSVHYYDVLLYVTISYSALVLILRKHKHIALIISLYIPISLWAFTAEINARKSMFAVSFMNDSKTDEQYLEVLGRYQVYSLLFFMVCLGIAFLNRKRSVAKAEEVAKGS